MGDNVRICHFRVDFCVEIEVLGGLKRPVDARDVQ